MMALSLSTTACEKTFSAMNRIKTKLKTNMKQETLQDLLVVSTTSDSIEEFNPKEANSILVSSGKNKRHFITSTATSTNSSSAQKGSHKQPETEMPPLPVIESNDDT